jgi:hypothetical protein
LNIKSAQLNILEHLQQFVNFLYLKKLTSRVQHPNTRARTPLGIGISHSGKPGGMVKKEIIQLMKNYKKE